MRAGLESAGQFATTIPGPVLNRVSERLGWVAMFVMGAVVVLAGFEVLLQPEFAAALKAPFVRLTLLGMMLASAGFIVVQRKGWLSKARLLECGLAYQVMASFTISVFETSVNWDGAAVARGLSGMTAWLVLCGLLLPNVPWKAGVAAACSVSCWPLAYWLNLRLNGFEPLPMSRLLVWLGPLVIAGVWMYLINRRTISMTVREYRSEQLGSYELERRIGQGGMGEVWRAKHRMLARPAAVKLIRQEVLYAGNLRQETAVLKRFEREAQATASLRSPHTVALFDYGQSKDGTLFYVMELLDGIDLQTLVERFGPMPPGRVVNLLVQVCDSLEEAHSAGLIHRDIKPTNLHLCRLGPGVDFVKVLDFGLVKPMHAQEESGITKEGRMAGTPAYLAPEVAVGNEGVDGRSDLYSLGCVAYFLLTGRLVFEKSSGVAQALAHVMEAPAALSARTELPVPAGLERVVLRLLEKKPEARFASAAELREALLALDDVERYTAKKAEAWWAAHLPGGSFAKAAAPASMEG